MEWSDDLAAALADLGWTPDSRLSAEDDLALRRIAVETVGLLQRHALTDDEVERLALLAFEPIQFSILNVDERTAMTWTYSQSRLFGPLVPLIDEATLAFYRGYYTAALATLFVGLERYLRHAIGWTPGAPDPSFRDLRERAVAHFPESERRTTALRLLAGVYARYDAAAPPPFYFNRHGLLHGLRLPMQVDRMNCARAFVLFDCLVLAEPGSAGRGFIMSPVLESRLKLYKDCEALAVEMSLLRRC